MKFSLDVTLEARIDTIRGQGSDTPFAQAVQKVEGVASVFGINDFVTVTRVPGADWDVIVCAVEEAAEAYLADNPSAPVDDEVARARKLLRDAVAPATPSAVTIGPPPERKP